MKTPLPEIDERAATLSVGSDRYPYTVTTIQGKILMARRDEYKRVSGDVHSGDVEYEYFATDAPEEVFTLRSNGHWVRKGEPSKNSCPLYIGRRRFYYDPSF